MKYLLHDTRKEKSIHKDQLEALFERQSKRVAEFFKRYSKPVDLEIHLSGNDKSGYHISYSLQLKDGSVVYADGFGRDLLKVVPEVFQSFIRALKKERAKERKEHLVKKAKRTKKQLLRAQHSLVQLHKSGMKNEFGFLMEKLLPSIKQYIARRIRVFEAKGLVPKGAVSIKAAFEEVKEYLYQNFYELEKSKLPINLWVYKAADEVLESILKSEAWDEKVEKVSIEELERKEQQSMKEEFSTDGDGDLVMIEELDDISYHLNDYTTDDLNLAVNEEENILEQLDEKNVSDSGEEWIQDKLNKLLQELPLEQSAIFDLHVQSKLSKVEIAAVKGMTESEVEGVLIKVESQLKDGLLAEVSEIGIQEN